MISEVFNIDCMEYMKGLPDKFFDLAIVDPEYEINVNHNMGRRRGDKPSPYKPATWDRESVSSTILNEIFRISVNQIIWGANHFISKMPFDSPHWILWDKGFSEDMSFAQFEMAWTSFDGTCKKLDLPPNGKEKRIHPTQKPIKLYKRLLEKYAHPGDKIFDSHMGSQSSRIAAYDMGFDYWGCEIDKDYFKDGCKRFENFKAQLKINYEPKNN